MKQSFVKWIIIAMTEVISFPSHRQSAESNLYTLALLLHDLSTWLRVQTSACFKISALHHHWPCQFLPFLGQPSHSLLQV